MAPLPTIGNCVRIGIPWFAGGAAVAYNVFHVITDSTDLEQIALDLGDVMNTTGAGGMFESVGDAYGFSNFDVTPLDGVTATQNWYSGHTFVGGTGGNYAPAVSALVSMKTHRRGARGRGRIYLPATAEGAMVNGQNTPHSGMTTKWNTFMDALPATDSVMSLGVASYTHSDVNGVTSLVVEPTLATQRRRQSRLR